MKKIDLHIHTKASVSDAAFGFSLNKLKEYVEKTKLDCIAITNHNLFDSEQYREISKELTITVLPGIEVDLEKGHILVISQESDLETFEKACKKVESRIISNTDFLSLEEFKDYFGDLNRYLLIPHYDKSPVIRDEIIQQLKPFISAGEVASVKKFTYCIKNADTLVPVLFSDLRFKEELKEFSPRQTFIDINDTSLKAIKMCLLDKNKVFLYENEGHKFFQVFENGQKLSTGLNVILGERSSGKTYTLKRICELYPNVKHIKQFELLETDEESDKKKFDELLSSKQDGVAEQFLKEFKDVVEDIVKIDRVQNEKELEEYLSSILKVAHEEEKKDIYSKCTLFNESKFRETENETLKLLIKSTSLLIDNVQYRTIIDTHISKASLLELIIALIEKYNAEQEINHKNQWINSLVSNISNELRSFTASAHVKDLDCFDYLLGKTKLKKFEKVVKGLKEEKLIEQNAVRRFNIIASTQQFTGAQELINKSGIKAKFSNAFPLYHSPVDYLEELKKIERLPQTEYYKYFVDIKYKILNEHGAEVSGGERSEFNLLEKIQNAHHYDLLLIDEPESSFDNIFLRNEVNEQIREISKSIPVLVVTHNNTVGASVKPDFLVYTKREIVGRTPVYKLYSGNPSDSKLTTIDGEEINNYDIMLNCLEAGDSAYNERKHSYEILKN